MMSLESDARNIFARFAQRCVQRETRMLRTLDALAAQRVDLVTLEDTRSALETMSLDVHDWIGEAKLLGLEKLSSAAVDLEGVLRLWMNTFRAETQSIQLRGWICRLTDLSRRLATEPPRSDVLLALQSFRSELGAELSSGIETRKTPTSGGLQRTTLGRRILILDDSPIVGEVLALELEARGHLVTVCGNLADFQKRRETARPEVVFLDINMPEVQGDELCRRLRQQPESRFIPIIFLSSLPDEELAVLAERAGASGYLSKQRGMDELIGYLDELLL
jgi:twitching motility two-component system response regulator PilH